MSQSVPYLPWELHIQRRVWILGAGVVLTVTGVGLLIPAWLGKDIQEDIYTAEVEQGGTITAVSIDSLRRVGKLTVTYTVPGVPTPFTVTDEVTKPLRCRAREAFLQENTVGSKWTPVRYVPGQPSDARLLPPEYNQSVQSMKVGGYGQGDLGCLKIALVVSVSSWVLAC